MKVQAALWPPHICPSSFPISQLSPKVSPSRLAPIPAITHWRSDPAPLLNSADPRWQRSCLTAHSRYLHLWGSSSVQSECLRRLWKVTEETGGAVPPHPLPRLISASPNCKSKRWGRWGGEVILGLRLSLWLCLLWEAPRHNQWPPPHSRFPY